jgi:hypothetical protein
LNPQFVGLLALFGAPRIQSVLESLEPGWVLKSKVNKPSDASDSGLMDVVFDAFCVQPGDLLFDSEDTKEFEDCQVSLLN